jgi:hypothetical protein
VLSLPAQPLFPDRHLDWITPSEADHPAFRSLNIDEEFALRDSLAAPLRWSRGFAGNTWVGRKLFNEHLIDLRGEDYRLTIDPVGDVARGWAANRSQNGNPYRFISGYRLAGQLGPRVSFYSDFQQGLIRFPRYVEQYVEDNTVVPGQGVPKMDPGSDLDITVGTGHVNYRAKKFFNLQFGHGEHFIGNGYRSMLLSDNGFPYLYFKVDTRFWKIKYTNLYTQMQDLNGRRRSTDNFIRKYVSSHYLSLALTPRLHIGLYEAVVYGDSLGNRGFDANYLNPVILYRPIEYALGSDDGNVLLGFDLSYEISDAWLVYGQLAIDEFLFAEVFGGNGWWGNKAGKQLGVRYRQRLAPGRGIDVIAEYNQARPYTYAHDRVVQNYGHYNQPLAHPLGANFREGVLRVEYQRERWFGLAHLAYQVQGRDTLNSNWGADVFQTTDTREQNNGNRIGQGVDTDNLFAELRIGFLLNPASNLRLEASYVIRNFTTQSISQEVSVPETRFFSVGLRTAINRYYYDF